MSGKKQRNNSANGKRGGEKKGYDPNFPVRIYADGVFDLFHFGHAKALEQAKKLYPYAHLTVGVCTDEDTKFYKGKTVMNQKERLESVRHCKWVDEVLDDIPWIPTIEFLDKHNIDYVAHDALPYVSGDHDDVYAEVKKAGRFAETKRTDGVSTSDLILRIIKDYNEYVLRNLSRGYSREELGVSLLKAQRIKAEATMKQIGESMKASRRKVAAGLKRSVSGNNLFVDMEGIFEKMTNGEVGTQMDKLVTGFISSFERGYRQFEKALSSKLGLSPKRRRSTTKKSKSPSTHGTRKTKNSIQKRTVAV
ncbi:hypothetical protein M9434_002388 [Picochlorum sp. BPE23]|nr:hypothetical protein M9435_006651 [Picochlorum sp. BPE23]KAI8114262.1 hypothetical protein M9434_002388 [Picochlorum sp. BPE23]